MQFLLDPTDKFSNETLHSWHFLTNPFCKYNSDIHSLVRGYSNEQAHENLKVFFKQAKDKKSYTEIQSIINNFRSVNVTQLETYLHEQEYPEGYLPEHVKAVQKRVNAFYDEKQRQLDNFHPDFRYKGRYYEILQKEFVF